MFYIWRTMYIFLCGIVTHLWFFWMLLKTQPGGGTTPTIFHYAPLPAEPWPVPKGGPSWQASEHGKGVFFCADRESNSRPGAFRPACTSTSRANAHSLWSCSLLLACCFDSSAISNVSKVIFIRSCNNTVLLKMLLWPEISCVIYYI